MNWTRHDTRALLEAADDAPRLRSLGELRATVRVIRRHCDEPNLVDRLARMQRFHARTEHLPLIWGESDCSLLIADWAIENGHEDPAANWRGAYSSEEQCRTLIAERGHLVDVVAACAMHVGLSRLHEPQLGAVAVIGAPVSERQWAAIWNGRAWLVKWGDERQARWTPFFARPLGIWAV